MTAFEFSSAFDKQSILYYILIVLKGWLSVVSEIMFNHSNCVLLNYIYSKLT